ncbi:MAG TPA: GNAT family N-acetyltransferase [Pirellulaceae bacterium]|nr:GNAT family N-acetyltransferase [Pirellulaceae bacterium]
MTDGPPLPREVIIRFAQPTDVDTILTFIRELAEYEKMSDQVVATDQELQGTLFGERPAAEALICEWSGDPVGFAVFFHNYSTFRGRPGLYLEDLYVRPVWRGRGLGRALLQRLALIAVERGCPRMEWSVLDWNQPAIDFYQSLGALPLNDWTVFRLTGESLRRAAQAARVDHE